MNSTIRFKTINRYGRAIGSIDTDMGYGVHQALVQRGIAEFVEVPVAAAVITAPEASADNHTETDNQRERKPRRSTKE